MAIQSDLKCLYLYLIKNTLTRLEKGFLNHRNGSLTHFYKEYLVVTRKICIFALYNVNKHSMLRQKQEKSGTGICHDAVFENERGNGSVFIIEEISSIEI